MGLCQDRREDWRWTKWSVCRAGSRCFTLSGTGRALAEQGLLHTPSPVPCFHAKLGAGGPRWSPLLCVLPLWCQRGIPTGETRLLALADPASTLCDPTGGSRAERLGLLLTFGSSCWLLGALDDM